MARASMEQIRSALSGGVSVDDVVEVRNGGRVAYSSARALETGEESVSWVMRVLNDQKYFPWIEEVCETDALSDPDVIDKTDAYVYIDPEFQDCFGFDVLCLQIKTDFHDFSGAGRSGRLLDLSPERWRELSLVVLFGQQTEESIVSTFLIQIMNYLGIWGDESLVEQFMAGQTTACQTALRHFLALDVVGRDWEGILSFQRKVSSNKVHFTYVGGGQTERKGLNIKRRKDREMNVRNGRGRGGRH